MNIIEDIAKDIIYSIDHDKAQEIEEDDDWVGSMVFQKTMEHLERVYSVGFTDGMEQIARTF